MRLAGQMKLGYYPAAPEAIAALLRHLVAPPDVPLTILDPCAGQGAALAQLARGLKIAGPAVHAVELDESRAEATRAANPDAAVLGPASFLGTRITGDSFSLAYVNPPFDDELGGGGREEQAFAELATAKLVTGGILALVMPVSAIAGNYGFKAFLDQAYADGVLLAFPEGSRPFREVCFLGRKRSKLVPASYGGAVSSIRFGYDPAKAPLAILGASDARFVLPAGRRPGRFEKVMLTEAEMVAAVDHSRLLSIFDPPAEPAIERPPLPPYTGHVAQLLAAGMLNGVVRGDDEPPHVVRGTAEKEDVKEGVEAILNADGDKVGERETYSQIIKLTVRAVGLEAEIRTFTTVGKPDK